MTDILILTHVDYCAPGHLATVLAEQGLDFTILRADLGELDGYDLDRPRAVAVMGGPMSVNDPLPWIGVEVAALQHFIQRDIPIIGHCLGGQLIARALGAAVHRMPYTEVGWQPLIRRERASPWLAHLPVEFPVYQWHSDTFDLPKGAEWLLSSPWCPNQGFTWGDKVLALQGHPEMTEELVRGWLSDWSHLLDETQASQQGMRQMLTDLPARVEALNRVADGFYRHWLALAFNEQPIAQAV
ncbi:type 1 glutamine amidotransferase [Aquipseudomonas ullengensis]|uniref:Type 1 glutamine amidotransferase n=1 Tax=Aquipseudomonas ullengensis TaxID=2759166 RepID=A0A7W4LNE8_9GAMM|nr:type 1 glutamine amidotransferase [Pseudomonas ullengensis]MBB2496371.1 type 1 glutamine amidotransferase [Pseudomonas ullengensis]